MAYASCDTNTNTAENISLKTTTTVYHFTLTKPYQAFYSLGKLRLQVAVTV